MGQGQGQEALARALIALGLALASALAAAQVNPLSILGRAVTTAMDVRTKQEVADDAEIAASGSKRLLEDKRAEWAGVTLLVFARHVVIAGAVKNDETRKVVEALVRQDKRIRSLKNELLVGDVGSLVKDTALEAEINAKLTSTSGIASVNMRWSAVGGRVVVMGVARSPQEAALAVSRIRDVSGVKSVRSHLRVVPAKK
jgi:osmotically-inducible protein OsmY